MKKRNDRPKNQHGSGYSGGKKKVIFFFARFFQRWPSWLFLQHSEAPHGTCTCPKPSVQCAGSWDERSARTARNERHGDVPAGFPGHRPAGGFPALSTRGQAHHLSTKMMTDECWQRTRALVLQPVIFKQIVHHPPLKKKQNRIVSPIGGIFFQDDSDCWRMPL